MQLSAFDFNNNAVRTTTEKDGSIWFVAKDVATALGYTNPQEAVRDHCKGVRETLTPSKGGPQKGTLCSNEGGQKTTTIIAKGTK